MGTLLELAPLAAFFIAWLWGGIYPATAALMVASVTVMLVHRALHGRFKDLHVITAVLVVVLGSATLFLHDKRFIQWKPTVLFGLLAATLALSSLVGARPLMQRLFLAMLPEGIRLSLRGWHALNVVWAAWFALVAFANLYIAQHYSETVWVHFHTYGVSVATLLFVLPQVFWLAGRAPQEAPAPGERLP